MLSLPALQLLHRLIDSMLLAACSHVEHLRVMQAACWNLLP